MFPVRAFSSSKVDFDRHVEECLKKINNETERNLRCFSFAKQYYKIQRYEDARRYLMAYLSVRPESAEAHCLLGKCLEALGRREAALEAYTTSLRIDTKQNNLVLKICELLASNDVEMDQNGAKFFIERAKSFDPTNPVIFDLKQRILTAENDDPREVTNLILKELETRPTDVKLRVRLLKHLIHHRMVKEAYKHVAEIESKDLPVFYENYTWYEAVAEVLVQYRKTVPVPNTSDWEFWFLSVSVLDKLVSLSLSEHENIKMTTEYINTLFNFDQSLSKAAVNIDSCPDKQLQQEFLNHYSAQLCFHIATVVFKQAKKDLIDFKEAENVTLPLLFASYHSQPPDLQSMWFNHASEERRRMIRKWRKEAAFRCSQAGHIIQALAKDRKAIVIEKVHQNSIGMWREQLYKKLFITRDQQLKMKTSYFLTNQKLLDIPTRIPDGGELQKYDKEAQLIFPDSLHHHIWIALNNKLSDYRCTVFEGLQYSIKNLKNCGAETLNLLDIEAFIYCATLCTKFNLANMRLISYDNLYKPNVLPAAVTQHLGSLNQSAFFKAAYKMYKNEYDPAMEQVRLMLVDGIKVIRCVDNILDVKVLVALAQTFAERSKNCTKQSEVEFNEARAQLYWKSALPILEKMKNNQAVSYPPNKLFNYRSKDMSMIEICSHIEAGNLFTACQLMKKKEYEKALTIFETLKDPYASFYQAQIYKQMADQQVNSQNRESVTSEMRSQNIILLTRARDCLYLTLDRLREPSADQKHPLNEQLWTEIKIIERLLSRIDPDYCNRNECDGMSDDNENVSSAGSAGGNYTINTSNYFNGLFSTPRVENNHSTPHRSSFFRREARPSPERLDAQLRQLMASKDAANHHFYDELRGMKDAINNLSLNLDETKSEQKSFVNEMRTFVSDMKASLEDIDRKTTDMIYEVKKELTELKKDVNKTGQLSEEDIYSLANEYGAEYNLNSNLAAYNSNLYPNYQARMPGATSLYGPPPLYPGMYPPMAYYGGLGLPQFGQEQLGMTGQDFRTISAALSQVQPAATYGQTPLLPPQTTTPLFKTTAVTTTVTTSKAPPVNVVITASDPLPTTKTTSQPILSVTIPPQHIKGTVPKNQPHNYQIPLPTTTVASTSPSVLNKPPPAISTQSILSNVAPPVYSAVSDSKSGVNVSLGLQIEKSLEQTFNSKNESLNRSNVSSSSIEEHDPCPDFKPIIPLPDEVPVITGEENDVVLFCERAKLFRYATENKEWRERGVGVLKILKNPETKKVRILMRRDQVLKICANHFITKEMTLTPMPKCDRAYIWAAHDYADEEVVLEKLCVRFKTANEAKKFYDAFEAAKKEMVATPKLEEKKESGTPKTTSLGGFVFTSTPVFKPKEEPVVTPVTQSETIKPSPFSNFNFGTPTSANTPTVFQTAVKESPDTKNDDESDEFVPTAEFKPVVPLPELVEVKTGEENCEVLFESRAKLLRFDTSGETKEWKEKGVGVIKLLKDSTVRLVMRRDQVLKVCCNHQLLKSMEFKMMSNNPKALTWCAKDFSEGVIKPETLAIKFKTEELASSFLKAVTAAQESLDENNCVSSSKHQKTETVKPIGFGDKFKPAKGSWECKNCFVVNDGKANYCVACETPKNDTIPKKSDSDASGAAFSFGVSNMNSWGNAFKPKEGSWECKSCYIRNDADKTHCVSCDTPKDDTIPKKEPTGFSFNTSSMKFAFGIPTETKPATASSNWGDLFKPKEGSWQCQNCLIQNKPDVLYCAACDGPKDDTVPKKEPKGINLDTPATGQKYTFGIPPTAQSGAKATFTFGQSSISSSTTEKPFVFKPNVSLPEKKESPDKFVFGSPQKHDFEFTPRSPRRISSGGKDEESDASYVEEECDNIYFKPVIPLPDKVEVKTGEEEEDVLYCHRAKLYRFADKEWKERGLGDLKILRRKDNGKLRVLMRREQVFKICLNHTLTPDVKYLPKDDKTWLFHAADYSEGELANEQFCLRFKNPEIAQEFIQAVNDALGGASSDTDKKTEEREEKEDDDAVIFVSETKVTPEEEAEARKLRLPPKFMNYRRLPDCECDQCKADDEYLKESKVVQTPSPLSCSSSTSSIYTTPREEVSVIKSPPDTESSTLKGLLSKPSLLAAPKTGNIFSPSNGNIFGSKSSPVVQSPSFTFGKETAVVTTTSATPSIFATATATVTSKPASIFGSGPVFGGSIFGQSKSVPVFGGTTTTATPTTTQSIFGGVPSSGTVFGSATSTGSLFKTTGSLFATPTTISGSIFGGSPTVFSKANENKPISGGGDSKTPIFGGVVKTETTKTTTLKEEDAPVLDASGAVSFAALAAKVGSDAPPAFAKDETTGTSKTPFAFLGAGAPVFASATGDKNKSVEDAEGGGGGDEEYDPHYDPIVPLPDAIVVSTGEEDEEVLFNERAKLFRYDADNKEWKERGIGQMKILHHPVNNTYRFLLRREQVHKVVLNQLIIPDLDLQPMKTSDKAWVWAGYNYTDDDSALEKLAIRFKNCDLAQSFYKTAQEVIEKVKKAQLEKSISEGKTEMIPAPIHNFGVEDVSGDEQNKVYDEEEDEEDVDEEEEDDDDDRTVMFMKRCTLSEEVNGEWQVVALGDLQVYYDPELYAARICFNNDKGEIVSNTLIEMNTVMTLCNNYCIWKAVEWNSDEVRFRTLKATFSSVAAAQEFHCNYLEGLNYAQEFGVVNEIPGVEEETESVDN